MTAEIQVGVGGGGIGYPQPPFGLQMGGADRGIRHPQPTFSAHCASLKTHAHLHNTSKLSHKQKSPVQHLHTT